MAQLAYVHEVTKFGSEWGDEIIHIVWKVDYLLYLLE